MKGILKTEWYRGLHNKRLVFASLLGVFMVIFDFISDIFFTADNGKWEFPDVAIMYWLPVEYQHVFGKLFIVMLPIIAALPFAGSYYNDMKSGYTKSICQKVDRGDYLKSKYLVTFVLGVIVIFIPLMLSLILTMTILPMLPPEPFAYQGLLDDENFLSTVFHTHPVIYALIYTVVDSLFGGVFAVISLCISNLVESTFAVLVMPFAIFILSGSLFEQLGITVISPYNMVNAEQEYPNNGWAIAITLAAGILITYFYFCKHEVRKDVM